MRAPARPSIHATHLDAIRAIAAFAVVLQHARQLWFVENIPFGPQQPLGSLFFWLTALGGAAVGAFFVLSGFLIASSVRSAWVAGRWSAVRYVDARLTRLLVPLIPALLLTAFWDHLGLGIFGQVDPYSWRLPVPPPAGQQELTAFLGNALFLQDVLVPVYGTNGPLWSLSREFWYYAFFPLLFLAFSRGRTAGRRAALLVAAVLVMAFAGRQILSLFPVWLCGVAVAFLPPRVWAAKAPFRLAVLLGLLGAVSTGWLFPGLSPRVQDYGTGVFFGLFVWSVLCGPPRRPSAAYERGAGFGADISYTLYLVHVPLLTFLAAAYLRDHAPLAMSLPHFLVAVGLSGAMVVYAIGLWYLFERNTRRIRAWFVQRTAPIDAKA